MSAESLTVVDNRTGVEYTLPIVDGAIHATELGQIKGADGAGLLSYDPAFLNTASCRSEITYIDGDTGILRYRGYPIEQVAEQAGFLESAYLLLEGELPTDEALQTWTDDVRHHTYVHDEHRRRSCRASGTTRTRWGCCSAPSARCRRSTRTPRTSPTRRTAICNGFG